MWLAVAGKGGAGKSVVAGTLARLFARDGAQVLALDSDMMPGLALTLGAPEPPLPPLLEAAEQDENGRWRLKRGIGPMRAIARFSTDAPDGIRLLQCGKLTAAGRMPIMGALNAYYAIIHRLSRVKALRSWTIVGDLPAGQRQLAFDWAPYAETIVLVVEPTWKSALTARRAARIARARNVDIVTIASQVRARGDSRLVERVVGEPVLLSVPYDEAVAKAEREGVALLDHAPRARAVRAIEHLADELRARSLRA
ncbi:MAG: hypothetical protein H0V45_08435 [Actinobacteria bacterium]|nr:hypothetical protein [Actinomycetota bacterium]